jgi:hypothetical protein
MITVDLQTFRQSNQTGNVTGVIYVELASGPFPERNWSDFPVIVLSWWAEALRDLETSARHEVKWRFMDGPFSLTLTKMAAGIGSGGVTFAQLEGALLEPGQRVVAYCEQCKILTNDLETLRENVQRLKANPLLQRTEASSGTRVEIRSSSG